MIMLSIMVFLHTGSYNNVVMRCLYNNMLLQMLQLLHM